MRTSKGFTLIEILIVIVIMGVVLTTAMLAFGDFGAGRKSLATAEHFSSYVKLVRQRAILEASTLGIQVSAKGYETFRFEENRRWAAMARNTPFRWQSFPARVVVRMKFNTHNSRNTRPDIIINPSGDMSPFTIFFGTHAEPESVRLKGLHNGEMTISRKGT